MNPFEKENKKRGTIVAIAGIVFVLAASLALLCGILMINLTGVHASAQSAENYGYDTYYINGEQVGPTEFHSAQAESAYSYDPVTGDVKYDEAEAEPIVVGESDEIKDGFVIQHINPEFTFNEDLYNKYMGRMWMVEIASVILAPLSLLLALIFCGRKVEDADGRAAIQKL